MNVSIIYTGVRVSPDVTVDIAAVADGRPIQAELDHAAIDQLLRPAGADRKALMTAVESHRAAIRRALEAHVAARGAPLDGHLTLTWQDLEPFANQETDHQPA